MVGERVRSGVRNFMGLRDSTQKFTKGQAYYVDDSFQKPFRCANCWHFEADNLQCTIVDEGGAPNPGAISPQGACTLFDARAARIELLQFLWGRGQFDSIPPEVARATAFMFTYAALEEEPPADLREKALFSPEQIQRLMPRKRGLDRTPSGITRQ